MHIFWGIRYTVSHPYLPRWPVVFRKSFGDVQNKFLFVCLSLNLVFASVTSNITVEISKECIKIMKQ